MKKLNRSQTQIWGIFGICLIYSLIFISSPDDLRGSNGPKRIAHWIKSLGGPGEDKLYSIVSTSDGGFVAVGSTSSFKNSLGDYDGWLVKINALGIFELQKTFGGEGYDVFVSIQIASDNGYILVGSTDSYNSQYNGWIMKLNDRGRIDWEKTYGGSNSVTFHSIEKTSNGYIIAGMCKNIYGGYDGCLIKINDNGEIIWQKRYGKEDYINSFNSICKASNGGYITCGTINSFEPYWDRYDAWVVKINENGDVEWQKRYGGWDGDGLGKIIPSSNGGYIAIGSIQSPGYGNRYLPWIISLNAQGNMNWQQTYDGQGYAVVKAIQKVNNGILVGGSISYTPEGGWGAWIIKADINGNINWQKTYGGLDFFGSIYAIISAENSFSTVGFTSSSDDWFEGFLVRFDKRGNIPACELVRNTDLTWINPDPSVKSMHEINISNEDISIENLTISPQTRSSSSLEPIGNENTLCFGYYPELEHTTYQETFCEVMTAHGEEWVLFCEAKEQLHPSEDTYRIDVPCEPRAHEHSGSMKSSQYKYATYQRTIDKLLFNLLGSNKKTKISDELITRIKTEFMKVPTGIYFNENMKKSVLSNLKNSKDISPPLLKDLIKGANAIALESIFPKMNTQEINTKDIGVADFEGYSWITLKNVQKSGKVTLTIEGSIPKSIDGYKPGWPICSYKFNYTGSLENDSFFDIHFYLGGFRYIGKNSNIRILEWNGKTYKDVTTHFDPFRKVISGRTEKLKTYIIASPKCEENTLRKNKLDCK